jgi:exopolysaccharide biosynthesis protein
LIVNGKILSTLKPGLDSRTAMAKTMVASQIEGGLGCINALNLDGGSSTQLYAKYGNFNLKVAGYSAVTDAILVLPRRSG